MKYLLILLLIILSPTICFAQIVSSEIEVTKEATTLSRWGNECDLKVKSLLKTVSLVQDGNKLKQSSTDMDILYSELEPTEQWELGGLKYEFILKKKPIINKITMVIESKNLVFNYQAPLKNENPDGSTWEYNSSGGKRNRPANVNGSYAVYHSNKFGHVIGETNYKCGKAFHIYRPRFVDDDGKKVWADLEIVNGLYTVTIPQNFIDTAKYPIRTNDTFGKTDIGGTEDELGGTWAYNTQATSTPASNGELTSIKIYSKTSTGSPKVYGALYSESGSEPNSKLAEDSSGASTGGSYAWVASSVSYSVTSGTQYWLAGRTDGDSIYIKYDDSGGQFRYYDIGGASFPATWDTGSDDSEVVDWSVYGEFTPAATDTVIYNATINNATIQ